MPVFSPPPAGVLTIGGSTVNLDAADMIVTRWNVYAKDGIPTLEFQVRGGPLPTTAADPYAAKAVTWTVGGTLLFAGDAFGPTYEFDERAGWIRNYVALGLRNRFDWVPVWDDNTGTDTINYNLPSDDTNYNAGRAGRSIGQIIQDALTQVGSATMLSAYGLINYTSLSPPTLPASTLADLANLTVIPHAVSLGGEKILGAIVGLLANHQPNHSAHVLPDGTLRIYDLRTFTPTTLTMGSDPLLDAPSMTRDQQDSFSSVVVRGQTLVEPVELRLSRGDIAEDWAFGSYTNTTAKAAWVDDWFHQGQDALCQGTCSVIDTTHLSVTVASPSGATWSANFWDQSGTGRHGIVAAANGSGSSIEQFAIRNIVANTSLSSGGSSTLTLDRPLAATGYSTFTIRGTATPASLVWRRYSIVNTTVGAAMQPAFPNPVSWINSSGTGITSVTGPTASIMWSSGGTWPYDELPLAFEQNPGGSPPTITFARPVVELFGTHPNLDTAGSTDGIPSDIRVLLAVAKGYLTARSPSSGEAGTCHSVDGISRTLYASVPQWKDPINQANMQAFADELLDSVKDTIHEGTITYRGHLGWALSYGVAARLAGATYATPWDGIGLPIVGCEVIYPQSGGALEVTRLHVSNRRSQYTASNFLSPDRVTNPIGIESGTFGDAVLPIASAGSTGPFDASQHFDMSNHFDLSNPWTGAGTMTPSASSEASPSMPDDGWES